MKKAILGMVILALCLCFSACTPMQPNTGTVKDVGGPDDQLDTVSSKVKESTLSSSGMMETNYVDIGLVGYKLLSIDFVNSPNDYGISKDMWVDQQEMKPEERLVFVKLLIKNISVPPLSEETGKYLVNVFSFLTEEQKLNPPDNTGNNGDAPGPLNEFSPAGEPVYFSKTNGDAKRYFELPLPTVGDETEFVLGWKVDEAVAEDIKNGTLQLTYSMMGSEHYVSFPYPAGEDK